MILSTILLSVIIWVHQPLMYVQTTSKRNFPRYCLSVFFCIFNIFSQYCCFSSSIWQVRQPLNMESTHFPQIVVAAPSPPFCGRRAKEKAENGIWVSRFCGQRHRHLHHHQVLILTILNQIKSTYMSKLVHLHHNDNHPQSRIYSLLTSVFWSNLNQNLFQSDGIDQVSK